MKPNTAGILALVEDTAVVEIRRALDQADEIVAKAVDKQLAAEIDREAAQAKQDSPRASRSFAWNGEAPARCASRGHFCVCRAAVYSARD